MDRPRVRVSPQEAGRSYPPAMPRAGVRAEVRALARRSIGPRVLGHWAFVGHRSLGVPNPWLAVPGPLGRAPRGPT